MLGTHDLALFVISGLLLNMAPGPDSLLIMARSATQGWRAGSAAALGIGAGTCVHILAAAQEGEVADFDLTVIDEISRNVPCLSKVSPNSDYHMEDVHQIGRAHV